MSRIRVKLCNVETVCVQNRCIESVRTEYRITSIVLLSIQRASDGHEVTK